MARMQQLVAVVLVGCGISTKPPAGEEKLAVLLPFLGTLRGLGGDAYGVFAAALSQTGRGAPPPPSVLQKLGGGDPDDTSRKLEALAPILEKLRHLDHETFGALTGMLSQAAADTGRTLLQVGGGGGPSTADKLAALQPVLQKLRGLDPKTFGLLSSLLSQATTKGGRALLQVARGDDPSMASKLEALQPVLKKLRGLDPKTFSVLSGMLIHATGKEHDKAFLQVQGPGTDKLEALKQVLEKLKGLDPKTFKLLSSMLGQVESNVGRTFLQLVVGPDPGTVGKLEALQPLLEKLKGLDPKVAGMLSNLISKAVAAK